MVAALFAYDQYMGKSVNFRTITSSTIGLAKDKITHLPFHLI
ncbi:MAG: hypothetical protein U0T32_07350 [Chitinophagales bacterium]